MPGSVAVPHRRLRLGHTVFTDGAPAETFRGPPRVLVTLSQPVSGVLSTGPLRGSRWVAIHLCGPPEDVGRAGVLDSTLLRVGVTEPPGSPRTLVRSYRTVSPLPVRGPANRFPPSAVCSLLPCTDRSPRPGSRQHPALWSPDFPRADRAMADHRTPTRGHPAGSTSPTMVPQNGHRRPISGRRWEGWAAG